MFQTVEKAPAVRGADLYVAELYNTEQEYAQESHVTDLATLERLSGKEFDTLHLLATEVE